MVVPLFQVIISVLSYLIIVLDQHDLKMEEIGMFYQKRFYTALADPHDYHSNHV